jgi:predicted lipoprotein with Yx(FWY)xxD motif
MRKSSVIAYRGPLIGAGTAVIVGFGAVVAAVAAPASGTPVAAVPTVAVTPVLVVPGGEGPSEPQIPTVVEVHVAKKKKLKLTNHPGFTLYVFSKDTKKKSNCKGACAQRWRPVVSLAGKPQAGEGADLPEIGSMVRDDGGFQVTFNDLPVYYFQDDQKAGDENGTDRDEFGGTWTPEPPRIKNPK